MLLNTQATAFLLRMLDSTYGAKMCQQGAWKALVCSAEVGKPKQLQHSLQDCMRPALCAHTSEVHHQHNMYIYSHHWATVGWSPHLTSAEQPAALPAVAGSCQACSSHKGGAPSPLLLLDPAGAQNGRPSMLGSPMLRVICDSYGVMSTYGCTRSPGAQERHVK